MSPETRLINRFPERILIVGDYDWKNFDVLSREIRYLNPSPKQEVLDDGFAVVEPRSITVDTIHEDACNNPLDKETIEHYDELPPHDDILLVTFNARGASSMAYGVANSPKGSPDGWIEIYNSGKTHQIPNYPHPYTVPAIQIDLTWLIKKHTLNPFEIFQVLQGIRPTKIWNFDTSNGNSPAWKSLTSHVIEYAKQFNVQVSTIQR